MNTFEQVTNNRLAYYWSRLDWLALIIVGIIDIWTRHGLDLAQILLLQGIFGLFVMLFEFPSGVLADVTKRTYLLVISYVIILLGVMTYFVANSFAWFILAELFFAIGLAGKSGADTALLYDTYLEHDLKQEADSILATGKSITYTGIMIMTAVGGVLSRLDWRLPLGIAVLGYLITSILYFRSYEPDRIKVANSSIAIKSSFTYLQRPQIIRLALLLFFVNVSLRISFWDYLPRMQMLNVDPVWYGLVLAGANAIALLTSLLIRQFKVIVNMEILFVISGVIGLILFLHQSSVVVVLVAILLHQVYRGGSNVIYEIKLNEEVGSDIRASLASLISAGIQGSYFIIILVLNVLNLSSIAIHQLNAIMGIIVAIILITMTLSDNHPVKNTNQSSISHAAD